MLKELVLKSQSLPHKKIKFYLKLPKKTFGQNKSAKEIKDSALKKHGQKAEIYKYYQLKNSVGILTGLSDINEKKKIYRDRIIEKYNKYEGLINKYDEFIILCNCDSVDITTKEDTIDIFNELFAVDFKKTCFVTIIYEGKSGNTEYSTCELKLKKY
jgi:hypothetical protein